MVRVNAWMMNAGICIPGWLHVRTEVSAGAKILYSVLAEEAQGEEGVFSKETEHYLEGVCDPFKLFAELLNHELVEVEDPLDESKATKFWFLAHPWMDNRFDEEAGE